MLDNRLCKTCPDGHISYTCKNHPKLHWSGKNMPGRSLFFFGAMPSEGKPTTYSDGHKGINPLLWPDGSIVRECECPYSDLVHVCGV